METPVAEHDHDPTTARTGGSSTATATPAPVPASDHANRRFETNWAISLFGTAVGAGVLFLPINAGLGGL